MSGYAQKEEPSDTTSSNRWQKGLIVTGGRRKGIGGRASRAKGNRPKTLLSNKGWGLA